MIIEEDEGYELAKEDEDEDAVYFDNPYFNGEQAQVRDPERERVGQGQAMLAESLKLSTQSFEHLEGPEKAHAAA